MLKQIFLFLTLAGILFTSCNREEIAPDIDLQSDFYPLVDNSVIVYDVDSTAYNNFDNSNTNYKFELKDTITNSFEGLDGSISYRFERYKRNQNNTNWTFQKVFTRNKSLRAGEEFINNQRFIKLIFPPIEGAVWNGNSKNNLGEQDYYIENGITSISINEFNFDSAVEVIEANETNLIREDVVKTTYAKNVGMVMKQVRAIDKNISTGVINNGAIYSYKVKSYK